MGRKATNEVERFWSKVAKGGEDECWEFLSKPQPSRRMDYRTFQKTQISGQRQGIAYAHRYMFELIYGTMPDINYTEHKAIDILWSKAPTPCQKFYGREEGMRRTIEWFKKEYNL